LEDCQASTATDYADGDFTGLAALDTGDFLSGI